MRGKVVDKYVYKRVPAILKEGKGGESVKEVG